MFVYNIQNIVWFVKRFLKNNFTFRRYRKMMVLEKYFQNFSEKNLKYINKDSDNMVERIEYLEFYLIYRLSNEKCSGLVIGRIKNMHTKINIKISQQINISWEVLLLDYFEDYFFSF